MGLVCKNCDKEINGNFCPNCGQSASTHAINMHYLWHDIQHGVFHVDKGLLYTAKELFTRPGHSIREFIQGKRVMHFKPFAMVFLLGSVYSLLHHYFDIQAPMFLEKTNEAQQTGARVNEWIFSHYALANLLMLPFISIASYLAFWKKGYNLVEHLVLNCFIAGQKLIVQFAFFPLLYIYNKSETVVALTLVSLIIDFILTAWTYNQFFNTQSTLKNILKTLLSYVLQLAFTIVISLLVGIILAIIGIII